MTSTCGDAPSCARPRSASRCSTPNRCCSSTTTSPRSANVTLSWINACVPTTIPASPDTISSIAFFRCGALIEPVSNVNRVACSAPPSCPACARSPSISFNDRACCAASTSVGASIAACRPASTTCNIARRATMVFPDPTSPWRRRFIGWTPDRSWATSSPISCWPLVSVNGSLSSKASRISPGRLGHAGAGRAPADCLRCARASWTAIASSHLSRCCASVIIAQLSGRWMARRAASSGISERASRRWAGSGSAASGTPSQMSRTCLTQLTMFHDWMPCAAG